MCLVPVYLRFADPTSPQADEGNTFQLSPSTPTPLLLERRQNANSSAARDRDDHVYLAYDLELHSAGIPHNDADDTERSRSRPKRGHA